MKKKLLGALTYISILLRISLDERRQMAYTNMSHHAKRGVPPPCARAMRSGRRCSIPQKASSAGIYTPWKAASGALSDDAAAAFHIVVR